MQLKNALTALAAGVALATTGLAMAASDGSLGNDAGGGTAASTGSTVISLDVPKLIKISDMQDISMSQSGTNYVGSDQVCVYRNVTGNYRVTAQSGNDGTSGAGNGTSGNFFLNDGSGSEVNYSVTWNGASLTEDTPKTGLTSSETTNPNCTSPNVTLEVTATESQVGAATSTGSHTDTLSLIVAAE